MELGYMGILVSMDKSGFRCCVSMLCVHYSMSPLRPPVPNAIMLALSHFGLVFEPHT